MSFRLGESECIVSIKGDDIIIIGFPYTNRKDTGRGIDRYLAVLLEACTDHGIRPVLIEQGLVRPRLFNFLKNMELAFIKILKTKGRLYHAIDPLGSIMAFLCMKKNIVTTIHDTIPLDGKVSMFSWPWFISMKLVMRISLIISDVLVVPFASTKETLVNRFDVPEARVRIVRYGIDLNIKEPKKDSWQSVSEDKALRLLFMGGGSPIDRGLEMVLNIFDRFSERVPNVSLTIVSKAGTFQKLNERVISYVKNGRAEILEFIPENEIQGFISKFFAFLYPSSLGFSYLVMQAMSAGVPVIASNTRDMRDYLENAGILCDQYDLECYTKALIELLRGDVREKVIRNQYSRLMEFSTDVFFDGIRNVYMDLISNSTNARRDV